jgi:hypothetical protein
MQRAKFLQRLQKELDAASRKKHLTSDFRNDPATAFSQSQVPGDSSWQDSDCLLVAVALLCGHLIPLRARASELAYQRNVLLVQVELFKKFKQQVIAYHFTIIFVLTVLNGLIKLLTLLEVIKATCMRWLIKSGCLYSDWIEAAARV